ncbi:hypothetical protein FSARC_3610 [Fusarium sarcochroum]|uniref:Uncharacterized protein n=1 Tax=Fusarium sarcochroum TaxID=1208366 RepID=A0A8H4U3L8_9HYPO|nr:hypothetical protein FSARC_3610 [Fusarium sarcochroum]
MSVDLVTSVLIPPFEVYQVKTPTATVIGADPTATTFQLVCPGDKCKPSDWNNTLVVGPWASKTVPAGAASTGTFHWMLAADFKDSGPVTSSIECLVSSGILQECTTTMGYGGEESMTDSATGIKSIKQYLELSFSSLPIVITAGQDLLKSAAEATATKDSASAEATSSEIDASGSEATATESTSSAATPQETSGAGSSVVRVLGALAMAGLATLIVQG